MLHKASLLEVKPSLGWLISNNCFVGAFLLLGGGKRAGSIGSLQLSTQVFGCGLSWQLDCGTHGTLLKCN